MFYVGAGPCACPLNEGLQKEGQQPVVVLMGKGINRAVKILIAIDSH
jgi:hypothetical protein